MNSAKQIAIKGRHIVMVLTPNQARALHDLVNASNMDGDHEQYLRGAAATPAEIRACRDAMNLTRAALHAAYKVEGQQ